MSHYDLVLLNALYNSAFQKKPFDNVTLLQRIKEPPLVQNSTFFLFYLNDTLSLIKVILAAPPALQGNVLVNIKWEYLFLWSDSAMKMYVMNIIAQDTINSSCQEKPGCHSRSCQVPRGQLIILISSTLEMFLPMKRKSEIWVQLCWKRPRVELLLTHKSVYLKDDGDNSEVLYFSINKQQ